MKTVQFLAPNQCYFYLDSKIIFQSYNTIVCTVENYENCNHPIVKITDGQPCSVTTAKWLNKFLQEVVSTQITSYKDLKKLGY